MGAIQGDLLRPSVKSVQSAAKYSEDVEVLLVKKWIGLHDDVFLGPVLELIDRDVFAALERLRDFGIRAHRDFFAFQEVRHLFDFLLNLVTDRLGGFCPARAVAVIAGPAQRAFQRGLSALARDGDEAEIIKLKDLR